MGEDGHVVVVEEAKFTKVRTYESVLCWNTCRTGLQLDETAERSAQGVNFAFADDFWKVWIEGTSTTTQTA